MFFLNCESRVTHNVKMKVVLEPLGFFFPLIIIRDISSSECVTSHVLYPL